jgi:putative FmdB family regulatory protein
MPLYEYECESGEHRFERIQKFSDPPIATCPTCGRKVRKLLSSPAIQFKGTGWYITDYARKSSGDGKGSGSKADSKTSESSTAESSTTSDSSSASSTKSETKSDTKSDPKTT